MNENKKQFIEDIASKVFIETTLEQVYLEGKKDGIKYAQKLLAEL